MGSSFKLLGKDFAQKLLSATSNPILNLFIGTLATTLVQSSSVTTSITVGMVAGGVLDLGGAVFIIMGANIGTTVTNSIVSIGHIREDEEFERAVAGATVHDMFNFLTVLVLVPIELMTGYLKSTGLWLADLCVGSSAIQFTSPIKAITKPVVKFVHSMFMGNFGLTEFTAGVILIIVSLLTLFLALIFIVRVMKSMMLEKVSKLVEDHLEANTLLALSLGIVATVVVQSSSIVTSMLVPLIGTGVMSIQVAFIVAMGSNIGTTITAILAGLAGNVSGLAIAFVHLAFNLTGVLAFLLVPKLRELPIGMSMKLAQLARHSKSLIIFYILAVFYLLPLAIYGVSQMFAK